MSYLDPPRLHFAGTFFTNPSTINNATENYSPNIPYNNNPPSDTNPNSVWWNPKGQAFFKIPGAAPDNEGAQSFIPPDQITQGTLGAPFCEVTSVVDAGGEVITDPNRDPVLQRQVYSVLSFDLGARVKEHMDQFQGGSANAQFGRIADIDPDFQSRSLIVGLRLRVAIDAGTYVEGTAWPMCIRDIWGRVHGGGAGGILSAGCIFTSVLDDLVWQGIDGSGSGSGVLDALYARSPKRLAVKLVVDGYRGTPKDPSFRLGRLVGTIGPQTEGEPIHFPFARRLFSGSSLVEKSAAPTLNAGYAKLWSDPAGTGGRKLILDLGNSIPTTQTQGGPFAELGAVTPIWFSLPPVGSSDNPVPRPIGGPLFSSADEFQTQYYTTAGIYQVDLTQEQFTDLQQNPVGIQIEPPADLPSIALGRAAVFMKEGLTAQQADFRPKTVSAGTYVALCERKDGIYVDNDCVALRLEKGAPAWDAAGGAGWAQGQGAWQTEITSNALVTFVATRWGRPADGIQIALQISPNVYQFRDPRGGARCINNQPLSAISVDGASPTYPQDECPTSPGTWTKSLTTGADGMLIVDFAAGDLGPADKPEWRKYLDGQMYLFSASVPEGDTGPGSDATGGGNPNLAILVFENLPARPAHPTWWADVYPILEQYARLYPLMRGLVDLSSYATLTNDQPPLQFAQKMQGVLSLPMSHPGFMPVTRDLSLRNRKIVLDWYAQGSPEGIRPSSD